MSAHKSQRLTWSFGDYKDELIRLLNERPKGWDHSVRVIAAEALHGHFHTAEKFGRDVIATLNEQMRKG